MMATQAAPRDIRMKQRVISLSTCLPLLLLCSACRAQQPMESPVQLQTLSYAEALQAYRHADRDENYRCIHQIADDQYKASSAAKPIAIVIDDALYLKLDGRLLELAQTDSDEKTAHFMSDTANVEAGYSIIKQFNFSEYNESDDRHVDFWVKTPSGKRQLKTFGNRCGI